MGKSNKIVLFIVEGITDETSLGLILSKLPYEIYFFSCNLEHVLHDELNVADDVKDKYAHKFADKFISNPSDFISYMNNPEFALTGEYKETWEFIKKDVNSLNRYTNFNLCLNSLKQKQIFNLEDFLLKIALAKVLGGNLLFQNSKCNLVKVLLES